MNSLSDVAQQIENRSFIWADSDLDSWDLKEVLLEFASELRERGYRYQIQYIRPDQADFRLRSKQEPPDGAPSDTIHFLDPGRRLFLRTEGVEETEFEGICAELTILGESDQLDLGSGREPELNLLTASSFQAELYAEFQRWERYDSSFGVAVIRLANNTDWRNSARELKHVGNRRDRFGRIHSDFVMGLFPSRSLQECPAEKLNERLKLRYQSSEIHYRFFHVPSDCSDWSQLQNNISEMESIKERDFVGQHEG